MGYSGGRSPKRSGTVRGPRDPYRKASCGSRPPCSSGRTSSSSSLGPADFPTRFRQDLPGMYPILGVWIAAAAVFVAAHVLLAIVRRTAPADDWARGLPVYAWILAAGISLVATVSIVLSFLYVLAGQPLADNFNAWLVAKVIVAPNVFLSGYASSLDLGRRIRAVRTKVP